MTHSTINDIRSFMGIDFTATVHINTYDGKPRGVRWSAGPIALTIDESWQTTGHDHRFLVSTIHCKTWDDAARRAIRMRAVSVRKARELIALYETCQPIIIAAAQAL